MKIQLYIFVFVALVIHGFTGNLMYWGSTHATAAILFAGKYSGKRQTRIFFFRLCLRMTKQKPFSVLLLCVFLVSLLCSFISFCFFVEVVTNPIYPLYMKTKTIITSLVATACLLPLFVVLVNNSTQTFVAKASCEFDDKDYNYHLECIGDNGSCKFVNPSGAELLCSGNKAIADPLPSVPHQ